MVLQIFRSLLKTNSSPFRHYPSRLTRAFSSSLQNQNSDLHGLTGGQIVYQKLKQHHVDSVCLYSGGAIMPVIDAFYKGDIDYYINTHEQSGGHTATGYAKASGKTGVSIVTSGPALTNSITALTDATNDSTPLIVISGQVPLKAMGTNAFQECPSVEITKPVTKWSYLVKKVEELPYVLDKAFHIAHDGKPGSVHIDLPKCVASSVYAHTEECKSFRKPKNNTPILSDMGKTLTHIHPVKLSESYPQKYLNQKEKEKITHLLRRSARPVLLLGKGCNNYSKEIRKFVNTTNIPVTTTIHAMGIVDERSPQSLQFLGMHGHPAANKAIQAADLVIALGTRFDDRITGNISQFAKNARTKNSPGIIHVNICPEEHDFVLKTPHNFVMDCGDFITSLQLYIEKEQWFRNEVWAEQINQWKLDHSFHYDSGTQMCTQEVISFLNTVLHTSDTKYFVTTGVGNHQMMAAQFIKWRHPNTFISSGSLGVMGTGVPYAIGCQIAYPDATVLTIDGDGSFNHTLSELKTIAEYNLPIKILIMNDGELSMVKAWETLFYDKRYTATKLTKNPDYVALAESFGIKGIRCTKKEELKQTFDDMFTHDGPILCDFRVRSDLCMPLVPPGAALDDMIMSADNKTLSGIAPN